MEKPRSGYRRERSRVIERMIRFPLEGRLVWLQPLSSRTGSSVCSGSAQPHGPVGSTAPTASRLSCTGRRCVPDLARLARRAARRNRVSRGSVMESWQISSDGRVVGRQVGKERSTGSAYALPLEKCGLWFVSTVSWPKAIASRKLGHHLATTRLLRRVRQGGLHQSALPGAEVVRPGRVSAFLVAHPIPLLVKRLEFRHADRPHVIGRPALASISFLAATCQRKSCSDAVMLVMLLQPSAPCSHMLL